MTTYSIPYGREQLSFNIPATRLVNLIAAPDVPAAANPLELVEQALTNPVGETRLFEFKGAKSAAIAINDQTRPVPHQYLLPPLLQHLEALGIPPRAINLIIATGTHPKLMPDKYDLILPSSIAEHYPVHCHDARDKSNLIFKGNTQRGTPVWINRLFAEADLRITVGNIEPHQFEGFSGGVKSAAIGLAGIETINRNHALISLPGARVGEYENNPPRQDTEEIGNIIDIHFSLNAILNHNKEMVYAIAGNPREVMLAGIPLSRKVCQVPIKSAYELAIVSPGGHPKDINLYQSQKALAHASLIMKPGGTMILAAACPDGSGSPTYEAWMHGMQTYEQIITRFKREGFTVGPHKAFLIARDASPIHLFFKSELKPAFIRTMLLNPVEDFQIAIDRALANLPPAEPVGIMPYAVATIPYFSTKSLS